MIDNGDIPLASSVDLWAVKTINVESGKSHYVPTLYHPSPSDLLGSYQMSVARPGQTICPEPAQGDNHSLDILSRVARII